MPLDLQQVSQTAHTYGSGSASWTGVSLSCTYRTGSSRTVNHVNLQFGLSRQSCLLCVPTPLHAVVCQMLVCLGDYVFHFINNM